MQIRTSDAVAMGALHALRKSGVRGIINGLDISAWDPQTDVFLTPKMRFNRATVTRGKAAAKVWLQGHYGLPRAPQAPVVAFLGRLTEQKGVDLLLKAAQKVTGVQVLAQEASERMRVRD
jgi:granule-bound starch synthase